MKNTNCSQCKKQGDKLRRGLCVKCYNAWHYQSIKGRNSFTCPKCDGKDDRSHGGVCGKCYKAMYYQANREHLIDAANKWIKNNIERSREIMRESAKRQWARLTPLQKLEKTRKQELRRSEEQMDRRRAYSRRYYQETKNTEHRKSVYRAAKEARRAREHNVPNTLTKKEWEKIKEAYDYCCAYCGKKPNRLTQDHVVPISKSGGHTAGNIVPACQPCNRKKWDNPPPEGFVMKEIVF